MTILKVILFLLFLPENNPEIPSNLYGLLIYQELISFLFESGQFLSII